MRRRRCPKPLSRESTILINCPLFFIVPQTCKGLNEASGEYQIWLNQVKRLRVPIPIPTDVVPSMAELKDWAISWLRLDKLWVKPPDDDDGHPMAFHYPEIRLPDNDDGSNRFVMANLIQGGKFVVILYTDGRIDLREIKIKSTGGWELREVTRYKRDGPERSYTMYRSQLLTETNLGCPLVAYVDRTANEYGYSFSKLLGEYIDHACPGFSFFSLTTSLAPSN
jgi:hypothetical protein